MIYKDTLAELDEEFMPEDRGEPCLNCRQEWKHHNGWACSEKSLHGFYDNAGHERYLTASMHSSVFVLDGSIKSVSIKVSVTPIQECKPAIQDLSDWRVWANNKPNECPCGIHKASCTYHG